MGAGSAFIAVCDQSILSSARQLYINWRRTDRKDSYPLSQLSDYLLGSYYIYGKSVEVDNQHR